MSQTIALPEPTKTEGAPPEQPTVSIELAQEVVAYGSPSDAGEGGRRAVREHAEALRRLRDA